MSPHAEVKPKDILGTMFSKLFCKMYLHCSLFEKHSKLSMRPYYVSTCPPPESNLIRGRVD